VIPTVLDTGRYRTKVHAPRDVVTLGWIGHSMNFRYLRDLAPALRRLAASRPVRLLVVADQPFGLEGLEVENRAWSEARETADLLDMDIGLMPLADDEWTRGKCAFKAIQYMAAGVPPVASDVGANRQLVDPGQDGFLASTEQQWFDAMDRLAADADLRARLGRTARAKVEAGYSLQRTGPIVAQLFTDLLREPA
jgi:glycosyltransferase involved in cell wall biosynthesis